MKKNFLHKFRKRLCFVCKNYQRKRKTGSYCSATGEKPDFIFECQHFRIHIDRDKKIHNHYENYNAVKKNILLISVIIWLVLLFIDKLMIIFVIAFVITFLGLLYLDKFLPHPIIKKTDWFGYLYLLASAYWINKNDKNFSSKKLLKQTAVILYGHNFIEDFRIFIINNKNSDDLLKRLKKYHKKISFYKKIMLLYLLTEMSYRIKGNIDEDVKKIALLLGVAQDITNKIAKETEKYILWHKAKKEKQNIEKYAVDAIYEYYLSILGLSGDVKFKEIKKKFYKLSKELHPDKYINTDKKILKKISEKYKKITEAYNFFKDYFSSQNSY